MFLRIKKIISLIAILCFVSSCGTVFNSERAFKKSSDQIDYFVFALDSFGIMFFVLPGILALSIDYATGALFLSPKQVETESLGLSQQKVNSLIF